jgi:hypothetical protein
MQLLDVLKKGQEIQNPAFWKRVQNYVNLVSIISPTIILLFPDMAPFFSIEKLAIISTTVAGINGYLTVATTGKIGL